MQIFIARLNYKTTQENLKEIFKHYGYVEFSRVVTDKQTEKSRGYGFISMPNKDEALAAIAAINGSVIHGRKVLVQDAAKGKKQ
jgi:RNA recognition motif-containing protein